MADWDDLRVFLAVARAQSLSGAGRRLRLDPATVGRRIVRLERSVGAPLFVKSPQGYALTEPGARLVGPAEAAEAALRAGLDGVAGPDEGMAGQVRIGAPDGCANYLLPQVCADIAADNPGLDIQIVALPRVVNLSRREADMAITVSPPTTGQLVVQKITDYRLHLACAADYLTREGPIDRVTDLRGRRMIGYIPDMIYDAELDYLSQLGVSRVALASNAVPVQLRWAAQGAGLCMAHDFALPAHPELVRVLGDAVSLTRSFYLVRHRSDQQSPRLGRFARALLAGLRDAVQRQEAASGLS